MSARGSCSQCGRPLPDCEAGDYLSLFCPWCGKWHRDLSPLSPELDGGLGIWILESSAPNEGYAILRWPGRPLISEGLAFATRWDPEARRVRLFYDSTWPEEDPEWK